MDDAVAALMVLMALIVTLIMLDTGGGEATASYRVETFAADAAAAAAEKLADGPKPPPGNLPARWDEVQAGYAQTVALATAGVCRPHPDHPPSIAIAGSEVSTAVTCIASTNRFGASRVISAVGTAEIVWAGQ